MFRKIFISSCLLLFVSAIYASNRIVTLAPNLAEIVCDIGACNELVGVSAHSTFPQSVTKLPIVATSNSIDLERMLSLNPNLIFAWEGLDLAQLHHLSIPVITFKFRRLSDIAKAIKKIGQLTAHAKQAGRLAAQFLKELNVLRSQHQTKKRIRVFYQLNDQPLMTINHHSFIDEEINVCGGENVFRNTMGVAPIINIEAVIKANPQVILVSTPAGKMHGVHFWQNYTEIDAVRHHRIYAINPDLIERPIPRIIHGIKSICSLLDSVK